MNLLNKAQADALFQREAFFIGGRDAVLKLRAVELLGEDAVEFAERDGSAKKSGGFGIGRYTALYLTYAGFLDAVCYYNVRQLEESQRFAAPVKGGEANE